MGHSVSLEMPIEKASKGSYHYGDFIGQASSTTLSVSDFLLNERKRLG